MKGCLNRLHTSSRSLGYKVDSQLSLGVCVGGGGRGGGVRSATALAPLWATQGIEGMT